MTTENTVDAQLTRLQVLKDQVTAMSPAQRDFVNGKLSTFDALAKSEQDRRLQAIEDRLGAHNARNNIAESRISDIKHKVEMQGLDLSSQARSIDALAARVRRLESDAPIKEILVVGLAGVLFVSLIVAVANAAADPI